MKNLKKLIKPLTGIFIIGAWFFIGYKVRDYTIDPQLKNIAAAKNIIEEKHYGDMPEMDLQYLAIRGMLYNLGDKRANLLTPEIADKYLQYMDGDYGVTGISSDMVDGDFIIKGVRNDSPAQKAGILKGDKIIEIDGWKVRKDSTYSENAYRIIGPKNTEVNLVIERDGKNLSFKVSRVQFKPIEVKLIDGNIGYIKLNSFNMNTAELMKTSLQDIVSAKAKSIIWDLRDNSGGEINTAVTIINYFLDSGNIITTKYKDREGSTYTAKTENAIVDNSIPIVVLVNSSTLSAGEVSASAIQENVRGILIGEKTYGKGTINSTYPLPDGSLIELTDGAWFSAKMNSYNLIGVTPNIEMKDEIKDGNDMILQKALEVLK